MKTILIYFTGTGNSLAVARLLRARLPGSELRSAGLLLDRSQFRIDADACGLVFPVYCQNVPEIMQRLVPLLQLPPDRYVFAVATHNGDVGYSHFTIDRLLRKNGQKLQAGFAVLMPGNSITPYDSMNPETEMLRRITDAASSVGSIAGAVARKAALPYAGSASLRKRLKGLRNMFRHKIVHKVPERFWATDACTRCGICERICPEHNIQIGSALPVWGKKCQMCLACIHWCPEKAVQNGPDTIDRKRYHHPDVTLSDMLSQ